MEENNMNEKQMEEQTESEDTDDIEIEDSVSKSISIKKNQNVFNQSYQKLKKRYITWRDKVIEKTAQDKEEDALYGSDWNQLGYQRTIAGFLYTFGLLIPQMIFGIFMIPLIQYTELRFVEVGGVASVAGGLFGALYTILDLDLEASVNRFVPQYAISDPRKAMHYVSFFIKYQMWSGLFQITFVSIFILFVLIPMNSPFAWVSWYMIFICVKQYPATLGTFKSLIGSLQHKNKENLIVFYRASIIEPLTKLGGGIIGLIIGHNNPVWGEMMGLALGTAIGGYVDDFFTFTLGTYWLSKILDDYDIKIRDIYADKIPPDVWKSALWFSARLMPKTIFGSVIGWSGFMITVDNLAGYTSYKSLTDQAQNLAKFITWSDDIINGSKAAFSEAYNNGKVELTKFYIANGLKYNFWMLMILGTFNIVALPAIFDIAIPLFMPEEWRPITRMVPIYVLLFIYKPFNDIADKMVFLSGHPEINTYIGIIQTIGNLFFTWFFLVYLEMGWLGLILTGVPMDIFGFIVRWIYMSKKVLKLEYAFWKDIAWQAFVAPFISGMVLAGLISLLLYGVYPLVKQPFVGMDFLGLEGGGILIPAVILIVVLLLSVVFIYFPLYSLLGGWDDRTLNIFRKCVGLTGPSIWLIYPMYKIFKKFHAKSPFKKRAYMNIGDLAQEELKELAIMRKNNLGKM
ncbi:MAG: hypothetical protein GF364_02340 [Candidatus Lokiarchaeota archaeon]|nr:hypothetical protein [Candidatus Lokiarchaeota archaeon]